MHRGTFFIITKDKDSNFVVQKSTEFNGGMGLNCFGKTALTMLQELKNPEKFDALVRNFDDEFFKYKCEFMTYKADSQDSPYIDESGVEDFEYSRTKNQFKFFRDDNGEYIYTSDSNYIKNMTDEDIAIVCCNGNYRLRPNEILISDYSECINNKRLTFGEKIDEALKIDELNIKEYIPTRKERIILDNIVKTFQALNYNVSLLSENGRVDGLEIETWTNGGVDMIHTIYFEDDYRNVNDADNVYEKLLELAESFCVDEEIEIYRQDKKYRDDFTIRESLEDFEAYEKRLDDLPGNFRTKYNELIGQKFMDMVNEIKEEEEIQI